MIFLNSNLDKNINMKGLIDIKNYQVIYYVKTIEVFIVRVNAFVLLFSHVLFVDEFVVENFIAEKTLKT